MMTMRSKRRAAARKGNPHHHGISGDEEERKERNDVAKGKVREKTGRKMTGAGRRNGERRRNKGMTAEENGTERDQNRKSEGKVNRKTVHGEMNVGRRTVRKGKNVERKIGPREMSVGRRIVPRGKNAGKKDETTGTGMVGMNERRGIRGRTTGRLRKNNDLRKNQESSRNRSHLRNREKLPRRRTTHVDVDRNGAEEIGKVRGENRGRGQRIETSLRERWSRRKSGKNRTEPGKKISRDKENPLSHNVPLPTEGRNVLPVQTGNSRKRVRLNRHLKLPLHNEKMNSRSRQRAERQMDRVSLPRKGDHPAEEDNEDRQEKKREVVSRML